MMTFMMSPKKVGDFHMPGSTVSRLVVKSQQTTGPPSADFAAWAEGHNPATTRTNKIPTSINPVAAHPDAPGASVTCGWFSASGNFLDSSSKTNLMSFSCWAPSNRDACPDDAAKTVTIV